MGKLLITLWRIDRTTNLSQDKKLESWIKGTATTSLSIAHALTLPTDRGFAGGGRNRPTVTSPKVRVSGFFPHSLFSKCANVNHVIGIQESLPRSYE